MDIRSDISELMSKCVGCGQCSDVCTSKPYGGCDPLEVMQGKLERAKGCIACGMCNMVCNFTIPKKVMMYAVNRISGMDVPQVYRDTGYNLPPSDLKDVPEPRYVKGAMAQLMPGCQVVSNAPYLEYATERVLDLLGVSTERYEGGCCTYPITFRGLDDSERDHIKKERSKDLGGRKLYTICPGCNNEMREGGFDSEHVYSIIRKNLDVLRGLPGVNLTVAVQTGCTLRADVKCFNKIVEACGCKIVDVPQGCCGKLVPEISGKVMADRQVSLKGVDAVVVGCPSCFARYDQYPDGVPVLYLTELILLAMGDERTMRFHRRPVSR